MKKLLLTTLFSVFIFGGAFAQFNYTTNTNIGQTLQNVKSTDKDTLLVHFNTAIVNSLWMKSKKTPYTSDSVSIKKCQTQKGMQALIYTDGALTTSIQSGNFKCASYTGNGNPVHVASLDSLLKIMAKSANTLTTVNYTAADSLTAPAHCLFDNGSTTNQVYGVYPGKYKHIEYGYYINLSGKVLTDDITFDLGTLSEGTTGKKAKYELTVYANTSTISTFSTIGSTTNDTYLLKRDTAFYVTGDGPVTVNLSTFTGKVPSDFTNKYVYIFLKTLGTPNASGIKDGLPNSANFTTHTPDVYDPVIYFDNFKVIYSIPTWIVPTGAVQNAYINHNNGTPAVGANTDFSGGTPVDVLVTNENTIKFYLTGIKRASTLTITEANDGGGPNLKYYFPATGAVKAKSGSLGYVTDVPYTFTPSDGSTKFLLSIPAPSAGALAMDTLELSINVANLASNATSTERLEINNGIRFYYTIGAKATLWTGADSEAFNQITISASNNTVFVSNATENVIISNINGQRVKVSTAIEASKGIHLQTGLYIVKTGNSVQKVLVK